MSENGASAAKHELDITENLIEVMRSKHASSETVILAAEAIIASSRFNIRFYPLKEEASKSDDEMLELLQQYEDLEVGCRVFASQFNETGDRGVLHANLITLRKELDQLLAV